MKLMANRTISLVLASGVVGLCLSSAPAVAAPVTATSSVASISTNLKQASAAGDARARTSLKNWTALNGQQKLALAKVADSKEFATYVASGGAAKGKLAHVALAVDSGTKSAKSGSAGSSRPSAGGRLAARATLYRVQSWKTYSYSILGVTITKVRQDFYYQTNGKVVKKVYNCEHSSSNYAPTRSISGRTSYWKSGKKAYCNTVWTIKYGFTLGPWGLYVGEKDARQEMVVNGKKIEKTKFANI